jgi:hypothetical protein
MSGGKADFMSQRDAMIFLGVPAGVMGGWRKRGIGPEYKMFDNQDGYWYRRNHVAPLAEALAALRGVGLVIPGVQPPRSRPTLAYYERGEPTISEEEMLGQLGVRRNIALGWRKKGFGPRRIRSHPKHPWQFVKREVEQIRAALLVLGEYGIGLPGVKPLTLTDAFLQGTE